MSDITLSPSTTIDFIADTFADKALQLSKRRPEKDSAAAERLGSEKANTRLIIDMLHSHGKSNQIANAFDESEKRALAHRISNPDPARALAYVPKAVAEEYKISV